MKTSLIAALLLLSINANAQAIIRLPVRTYIGSRSVNPSQSPFYTLGLQKDPMVQMIWFGGNPPGIANRTDNSSGWTLLRKHAYHDQREYRSRPLFDVFFGSRVIEKYHVREGWGKEWWSYDIATRTWYKTFDTGLTKDPGMFPEWDTMGFADHWNEYNWVTPDGEDNVKIIQAMDTGTSFRLKKNWPGLLPTEVIVEFGGLWWQPGIAYTGLNAWPWQRPEVLLYPGLFNMNELPATPQVGRNNKIIFYRVRPSALVLN